MILLLIALASIGMGLGLALPAFAEEPPAPPGTFRVCADPNNMPFSNEAKQGFENKLADLIGGSLGEKVTYYWHAQRRGFVRQTLKAKNCDVVMGMPTSIDMIMSTKPYYRSTYVFVSRADRKLDIASIKDPRLHNLKIGVQLIGNDGFNTPPAHALSEQGMVKNIVGYMVYGDYRQANPPARIVKAVADGDIDIAAVWGPLAGYFAKQSKVPLRVTPITDTEQFKPLLFQFDIGMGVRKGDTEMRAKLDRVLAEKRPEIEALLRSYGIPTVPISTQSSDARTEPRK